jgi:single-strand DNA-binding protein
MGVNRVFLIGNLGSDPELRTTQSGTQVANFRLATTERGSRDQQTGEAREFTEWHNIVAWGKAAELCKQYLTKGRQVCIEGRIRSRSWDDKTTGQKRWITEIHSDRVHFIGTREGGGGGGRAWSDSGAPPPPDDSMAPPQTFGGGGGGGGGGFAGGTPPDDDIPF